ncbi:MAG: aminotransferase class III-fold pyridoxal phosphate-dependent enzyme, partial [Planctomycetota bacterium]|nr:aminotransferase class III-fold pyridoxal phosphate-dependent enzyme [Planctomycetota bacterium]
YVTLSDAYHGDTIGTVSLGDVPLFHELFKPLLFEPIRFNAPSVHETVYGEPTANLLQTSLQEFESLLAQNSHQIAALVVEPLIQGAAGIKIHPTGFLRGIADLAKQHDILLIADEVAVGFGRTGKLFACDHEQVDPDILCLGKGLSGGYLPISATLSNSRIYDAFLGDYDEKKTLFHGHTFAGNPLAAAVSLASLELFESEQTLARLEPKIEIIKSRIDELATHPNIQSPRSLGMVAAFDLKVPGGENETEIGYRFCAEVQKRGVRLRPLGATVIIMPPLVIEESDLHLIFDAIDSTLRAFAR